MNGSGMNHRGAPSDSFPCQGSSGEDLRLRSPGHAQVSDNNPIPDEAIVFSGMLHAVSRG